MSEDSGRVGGAVDNPSCSLFVFNLGQTPEGACVRRSSNRMRNWEDLLYLVIM